MPPKKDDEKKKRAPSKPKAGSLKEWETLPVATWLQSVLPFDDYSSIKAQFAKQKINSRERVYGLDDSNMKEMEIPIGTRKALITVIIKEVNAANPPPSSAMAYLGAASKPIKSDDDDDDDEDDDDAPRFRNGMK